jgi:hypothetical protein
MRACQIGTGLRAVPAMRSKPSVIARGSLALLVASPVLLIALGVQAQDDPLPPAFDAPPQVYQQPGIREHYVPQHFDATGKYVAPHYEAQKELRFRGYYDKDIEARRLQHQQKGYALPEQPDTTPALPDQRPEGR